MGSKGTTTTTNTQGQSNTSNTGTSAQSNSGQNTYSANPLINSAAAQALGYATSLGTPNAPLQGVANFVGDQWNAFDLTRGLQNAGQPYMGQAANYYNQSAAPISGSQIANYLNPYASNVLANLREGQGQQMKDLTGRLTQTAGGVGADRIGVAQGELARQHALAEGQTLSGIYNNALGAAQQDASRQANAAAGFGNLSNQAFNQQGAAAQALYNMGSQQQQLDQARLNSQYQQQMQNMMMPYQQAQFLSGITGSLAPALGGTTTSNQNQTGTTTQTGTTNQTENRQVTRPGPNMWSQILGAGLGLAGTFMGGPMGGSIGSAIGSGLGGGMGKGSGGGTGYETNPWSNEGMFAAGPPGASAGFYKRGGIVRKDLGGPLSFEDRAAPAQEAIGSGVFDPQGNNYTDFATPPAPSIPMPMARPAGIDPPVPDTDISGAGPAIPTRSMAASSPQVPDEPSVAENLSRGIPYGDTNPTQDASRQFAKNPWSALAQAGFSMMAGDSPHFGVNVGKGLLSGMDYVGKQRKELEAEEGVNMRARQLALEAQKHLDQYSKMTPYQKAQVDILKQRADTADDLAEAKRINDAARAEIARVKNEAAAAEKDKKLAPFETQRLKRENKELEGLTKDAGAAKEGIAILDNMDAVRDEAFHGHSGTIADWLKHPATVQLNSQANRLTLELAQKLKGSFSDRDIAFIKSMVPNASMPGAAGKGASDLLRAALTRSAQKAEFYKDYHEKFRDLNGVEKSWDAYQKANPILRDSKEATGGKEFNPDGAGAAYDNWVVRIRPAPKTRAEYEKMSPGDSFVGSDGKMWTKP